VQDELPAVNDPELECTKNCQDPFSGQDPDDGAIKLLAAVCDSELEHNDSMDGGPKEDNDVISASQGAALAKSTSMISESDDPGMPQQVVEVGNDNQEWEICDIIGKEDIDGVPHYWVQWSATLVSKYEMGKARALVARFEAQLRAQGKQRSGKGRGRLLPSNAGKQATGGVHATGETQQKRGRGRPWKQV
jgi:hypothetical protein